MGIAWACGPFGIPRSLFHYESRRTDDEQALTRRMAAIEAQKRRYGCRRIHVRLQREGWTTIDHPCWPAHESSSPRLARKCCHRMRSSVACAAGRLGETDGLDITGS